MIDDGENRLTNILSEMLISNHFNKQQTNFKNVAKFTVTRIAYQKPNEGHFKRELRFLVYYSMEKSFLDSGCLSTNFPDNFVGELSRNFVVLYLYRSFHVISCCGVVVITFALHTKGPQFDPGQ